MRKIFLFILIFFSSSLGAQPLSPQYTVTSGFTDLNPRFGNKRFFNNFPLRYELIVFERHIPSGSNICMLRAGSDTISTQVTYVTNDSYMNTNPAIAYTRVSSFGDTIARALIVWESFRNGKSWIYAKAFNSAGWSEVFAIDTSEGNKYKPDVYNYGADLFAVVYENNGDIQYKHINVQNLQTTYSFNLTQADTAYCSAPRIGGKAEGSGSKILISYNRRKANNQNDVYCHRMLAYSVWLGPDTVSATYDNKTSIIFGNHWGNLVAVYERIENGKSHIRGTIINMYNNSASQKETEIVPQSPYATQNFDNYFYPIITDNMGEAAIYNLGSYSYKTNDSLKLKLLRGNFNSASDSVTLGDSSKNTTLTINNGIYNSPYSMAMWVVYSKDSLTFSNICAKRTVIYTNRIEQLGLINPNRYNLYQNFPNPFNPSTNIEFDVPKTGFVNITVFDLLGREIAVLVNQEMRNGRFNVTWNANHTPSGIYFCRMTAGDYLKTMRMLLIK
ncbi:MAG TPA: T9SS type A sorting domain-containing protein [Ignavibacteria bacterium]|nr:T9SS type A sorting domain-containing protein [Ignavibacteria bacterium]